MINEFITAREAKELSTQKREQMYSSIQDELASIIRIAADKMKMSVEYLAPAMFAEDIIQFLQSLGYRAKISDDCFRVVRKWGHKRKILLNPNDDIIIEINWS